MRRILVLGGIGLALAGAGRLVLAELTERAWETRKRELLGLALFRAEERRPWEVRFDALQERSNGSPRFTELVDSPHHPYPAWGGEDARALDDFERLWIEAAWGELSGLERVLDDLRALPLEDLEWHGETVKLLFLREVVALLCARAWLAIEDGEQESAALAYADALRLARATDDGTIIATMIRSACEDIVLRSLRAALEIGAPASDLRAQLTPFLEGWAYDPDRAERVIRRDLSLLGRLEGHEEGWDESDWLLAFFRPLEEAIALAHRPVEAVVECRQAVLDRSSDDPMRSAWWNTVEQLHRQHARRNVALTALAVAAFRERNGRFPASLGEITDLAAEESLDTLTGAPLPYSTGELGARIGPASWAKLDGESPPGVEDSLYVWTLRRAP